MNSDLMKSTDINFLQIVVGVTLIFSFSKASCPPGQFVRATRSERTFGNVVRALQVITPPAVDEAEF